MRNLFLLVLFFQVVGWSQEQTPFDFLAANAAWRKASRFSGTIGGAPKDCAPLYDQSSGATVLTCAITAADYNDSVITKIDYKSGKLPEGLKKSLPAEFLKEAQAQNVSCVFRVKATNDNRGFLGCKDSASGLTNQQKNAKCGDDFSFTHGMAVGVGCETADGKSKSFTYSTDLYSNPNLKSEKVDLNGTTHLSQKFTSENIFSWMEDNINQGEATYWKRGVGFINLSDKKKWGLGQSTGQQEWFHHIVNKIAVAQAYDYTYVDGSQDRWGAFVALNVGLQENRQFGDKCQMSFTVDVGGRLSSLKDANTLNLNAEAKFSYQVTPSGSIYLRAQNETVMRPGSTVTQQTLATGFEKRRGGQLEASVTKQTGNRTDVPDKPNIYSNKNDLIVGLVISYKY